ELLAAEHRPRLLNPDPAERAEVLSRREAHTRACGPGVETMRSKHLLAITLLLPFLTMSSVASAGQTYGHWQKTTRLPERVANAQAGPLIPDQYRTLRPCTYQGGPKTNTWSCW